MEQDRHAQQQRVRPAPGTAGAGAPKSWLDETLYRRAEKKYKRYTHKGAAPTDFSEVVDCSFLERNTADNRQRIRPVANTSAAYELDGCPGLYVLPGALSADTQRELVISCCTDYHCAPHCTNRRNTSDSCSAPQSAPGTEVDLDISPAEQLAKLQSLRWATLGYQYQWASRSYVENKRTDMPTSLCELSRELTSRVGQIIDPQSAIINYYTAKSTSECLLHSLARPRYHAG